MSIIATSVVVGLHLTTAHFDTAPDVHLQDRNPGVYVRLAGGETAGVYRNSIGRTSVYIGKTWTTDDGRFAVTVGGVSGYGKTVSPLVVPSVRLGLGAGYAARVSYLAKAKTDGTQGVHLSVERSF